MSLTTARYKGIMGVVIPAPHPSVVTLYSTTGNFRVTYQELENGNHILPVPFYMDSEVYIEKQLHDNTIICRVIGARKGSKYSKIKTNVNGLHWFCIDTSEWSATNRRYAKLKYGLNNLNLIPYLRTDI